MKLGQGVVATALAILLCANADVSAQTCNSSWRGNSIHAATSDKGHIVVLRGEDNLIRFNEWRKASQSWSGWQLLPNQTGDALEPWIQPKTVQLDWPTGLNVAWHNIYARTSSGAIRQWSLKREASGEFAVFSSTLPVTTLHPASRVASAILSNNRQMLFARMNDGTLRSRMWNGAAWSDWVYEGIGGLEASTSPWVTQVGANTVNLYVGGGVYSGAGTLWQRTWNGTGWSVWIPFQERVASDFAAIYKVGLGHRVYAKIVEYIWEHAAQSDYTGSGWTDWDYLNWDKNVGMQWAYGFSPVVSGSDLVLYAIDQNKNLWTKVGAAPSVQLGCP